MFGSNISSDARCTRFRQHGLNPHLTPHQAALQADQTRPLAPPLAPQDAVTKPSGVERPGPTSATTMWCQRSRLKLYGSQRQSPARWDPPAPNQWCQRPRCQRPLNRGARTGTVWGPGPHSIWCQRPRFRGARDRGTVVPETAEPWCQRPRKRPRNRGARDRGTGQEDAVTKPSGVERPGPTTAPQRGARGRD